MTISVAIIGSGIFARDEHLPAVKASAHLALKAIYSRSLKSAKALSVSAGHVDLYSNDSGSGKTYHDLLLRSDIDAVIVALPIKNQPEYVVAALKVGKHVLSEKPTAENLKDTERVIKYYNTHIDKSKTASGKLGKVLGFHVKVFSYVQPGSKWYETEWRKNPTHQGGFFLDGGIHFIAGTRILLGPTAKPIALSAYTTLLQPHLPPVDTVNSIWLCTSGISGTFSMSFGTTFSGMEYHIACENGTVSIIGNKVTVHKTGEETVEKDFPDEGSGVKQEVAAWVEALVAGKPNPRQSPEEALADLEILEKMLRSGEARGRTESLLFQP